ncbi:unnamed protein product [Rotaria magnacalcarata]|uniref:Uncharacterized protein n=1 Tax=Rotaria magnacalcarata TaxID=392030 RepID=A0A820A759_9BILA|nr:unnamed protein product [Rotaria magnacalcarata]CAF4183979.1 unnamed protein product [Rotaria magnacalcarata]
MHDKAHSSIFEIPLKYYQVPSSTSQVPSSTNDVPSKSLEVLSSTIKNQEYGYNGDGYSPAYRNTVIDLNTITAGMVKLPLINSISVKHLRSAPKNFLISC